jgi:hypothetical protein
MRDIFASMKLGKVVDPYNPNSLAGRARARRLRMLCERFPQLSDLRVLDLGGVPEYWATVPMRPKHVTMVNLEPRASPSRFEWIEDRIGDACDLPEYLRQSRFDLVLSNSVIEHVGGHTRREQFAATVRAAAPHYWVQTPYRYFPIEPHWVFPGQQFLPTAARALISRRWSAGHIKSADPVKAVADVLSVELLGLTDMRHYFPDASILRERFAGLTKSIIAVR